MLKTIEISYCYHQKLRYYLRYYLFHVFPDPNIVYIIMYMNPHLKTS